MKRWKLAALVLSVPPLVFAAGPAGTSGAPTTQPADEGKTSLKSEPTTRPDRLTGPDANGWRGRGAAGQRMARLDPGTQADWESINGFMTKHSPSRLKFINGLSDGPQKFGMMNTMIRVSRNLERLDKDDPELSHIVTSRVELEDKVFDLASRLRNADPVEADDLKQTLKQKVEDLVDSNMTERKLRLDRLKKTVDVEQQNLARDSSQRERLVDDRVRRIIDEAQRPNGPLEPEHSDQPYLASPESNTQITPGQK